MVLEMRQHSQLSQLLCVIWTCRSNFGGQALRHDREKDAAVIASKQRYTCSEHTLVTAVPIGQVRVVMQVSVSETRVDEWTDDRAGEGGDASVCERDKSGW
jgi:hypothetical protein